MGRRYDPLWGLAARLQRVVGGCRWHACTALRSMLQRAVTRVCNWG